jgi:hypothetical protein
VKKSIEDRLTFLEESRHSHFNITRFFSGESIPIDIYALMVLKRSISLVFGFTGMIRNQNFVCASPLIRLQIDNLLRFRAAFMVGNQSQFVVDVIQKKEVRRLKDRHGKNMTDAYLQEVLMLEYPWLKEMYKNTSGYIHLSDQHFYNTLRASESRREGALDIYIGPDDKMISAEVYEEAIEEMVLVTHSLLTFLANWAMSKNKSPIPSIE